MSASYQIDGMDDFFDELENMEISDSKKRKALNSAGDILVEEIRLYLPKRSGKYREELGKKITNLDEGLSVVVNSRKFYDVFQEFGVSNQENKNLGSFEKGVNHCADKVIETIVKELTK